jgi:hypothetical protein
MACAVVRLPIVKNARFVSAILNAAFVNPNYPKLSRKARDMPAKAAASECKVAPSSESSFSLGPPGGLESDLSSVASVVMVG